MARVVLSHIYPPIPTRQFDWQAHYDGEEDEQMDTGHGATAKEARRDLIRNHPRPFNLADWLEDRSPLIIVRHEGGRYERSGLVTFLKFIFHGPSYNTRNGGAISYPKCFAGIVVPFTKRAFGYDFIIGRMYKIWNKQAEQDPEYDPAKALTWRNAWRWTNPLPEYE